MSDRYQSFAESAPGRFVTKRLGMPQPAELRRYEPGDPLLHGPALIGGAAGGRLLRPVAEVLRAAGVETYVPSRGSAQEAATAAGLPTEVWNPDTEEEGDETAFGALVYDASGLESSDRLRELYEFLHPTIRRVQPSGRIVVLATPPEMSAGPRQAIAQRALEGFVRSAAKEVGKGSTAQLVYVAPGAEAGLESTLRFLLSGRSAYVSGQVVRIGAGPAEAPADWERPLDGKVALVTGASRGIGEAIAEVLARDGAHVVCLDVPDQGEALVTVANRIDGSTLQLDITAADAPRTLVDHLRERHGGVDVVVHNAGVTRDKTLGRMSEDQWDMVLGINLTSQERINDALLSEDVLRAGGRIVTVSSVSGIAGNRGQANYATSKAGVIGTVAALAPVLAERRATINAVAPGFIETQMTAAMPVTTREAGRRMNSLAQGGLPVDVAETIAWFAGPGSGGVNGNVVRVCGQSLLGA
jgi:3-oxoacyl-[acyl-carrier protein] reductase